MLYQYIYFKNVFDYLIQIVDDWVVNTLSNHFKSTQHKS